MDLGRAIAGSDDGSSGGGGLRLPEAEVAADFGEAAEEACIQRQSHDAAGLSLSASSEEENYASDS